jgi:hypothetical protein
MIDKIVRAELSVINGVLTCYSVTKNVTFDEAMEAVIRMRDELNRQIDKSGNCPFNPINKK